jgi:hypothetical protein
MKENLLHFIWKLQLFSTKKLVTTKNKPIQVISAGLENVNSGPDFLNSKIEINGQLWAGTVEIHINSSDWYQHKHEIDENYESVILHVVWEHDVEVYRKFNQEIPTLELKQFILPEFLLKYQELFQTSKKWIYCENEISTIDSFVLKHWFERLYFERLEQKSKTIQVQLSKTKNDWEATFFVLLAKNFGLKVNGEAFLNFATSFDFSVVRKVSDNRKQLEALFFGQAGLLLNERESIDYNELKLEYEYLKSKFQIQSIGSRQIQFFRLRPNNFPTIRLSQLASLYYKYQNLFSKIIEIEQLEDFYKVLGISTSEFWETHYTFDKESKKSSKKLTKTFIDLLLINTIIPMKFLYLKSLGKSDFSSVISIIEQLKPEKNSIISMFSKLKIKSANAFESQALLELKNNYCNQQKCLNCEIGIALLKS